MDNAQDAYVRLVEDCRLGLVRRVILRDQPRNQVEYVPFKPDVALDNLPVFHLGVLPKTAEHQDWFDEASLNQFRLPYPRCGFLYRSVPTPRQVAMMPDRHRKGTARWYFMLCDEVEDGVLINSFVRHDDQQRWSQQIWQAMLEKDVVHVAYDPASVLTTEVEFMKTFSEANFQRIYLLCADIDRMMSSGTGRMALAPAGTAITTLAVKRRRRDEIETELPAARVLSYDKLPPVIRSKPDPTRDKSKRAAHFRRGGWRQLPSGRKTWVRAMAIHGGGTCKPPW